MQTNFLYIKKIAVVSGLVLGAFSLSVLANWSAPEYAPIRCDAGKPGCDAPINVGASTQSKAGKLLLGTDINNTSTLFDVLGNAVMTTIGTNSIIVTGSASADSLAITGAATAGSVTATGAVKGATLESTGLTTTGSLKVTAGALDGKYLKSDASGNAAWAALPAASTITVSDPITNVKAGPGGDSVTLGSPFQYKACFLTETNVYHLSGSTFQQALCRIDYNRGSGVWSLHAGASAGDRADCAAMCI